MQDYKHPADEQILKELKAPFEKHQEKKRKGPWDKKTRKNKYFIYIPVHYIWERLDNILGVNWNWEILEEKSISFRKKSGGYADKNTGQFIEEKITDLPGVSVTGRLTITFPSGKIAYRDGIGGATIDKGMDAGDAQKIAVSNAFKKAAFFFGVTAYLALDGDEAVDDTTTFTNDYSNNYSSAPINPTPVHINVGQGTAAPPQFVPNPIQPQPITIPMPSPYNINSTDDKY